MSARFAIISSLLDGEGYLGICWGLTWGNIAGRACLSSETNIDQPLIIWAKPRNFHPREYQYFLKNKD
jgi:hypothetical protein